MIENKDIIEKMLYLQLQLNNRIYNFVAEEGVRKEITEETLDSVKELLIYTVEERFRFMK